MNNQKIRAKSDAVVRNEIRFFIKEEEKIIRRNPEDKTELKKARKLEDKIYNTELLFDNILDKLEQKGIVLTKKENLNG